MAAKESACGTDCNWSPWKYKKNFIGFLHQLEINTNMGELQKAALLCTARILRKVLEL